MLIKALAKCYEPTGQQWTIEELWDEMEWEDCGVLPTIQALP
jgi:hypothetical protein